MTLPKNNNIISRFSRNAAQACIFFMKKFMNEIIFVRTFSLLSKLVSQHFI